MRANAKQGFTLIELLIVVAIIGLLATLAVVSLTSAQQRARDTKRIADTKSLQTAMELYLNDQGVYPELAAGETWTDLGAQLTQYVSALPVDPEFDAVDSPNSVYTYGYDSDSNDRFVVSALLEDTGHVALDQSGSGTYGSADATDNWHFVTSNDAVAADRAGSTVFNCDVAGVYCLTGDARP